MASPQITNSLGVVATVSGVEIHATRDGRFAAIVNGILVELASKGAVTKRIEGLQTPLAVMSIGSPGSRPKVRRAVRVTRAKQIVTLEEKSWPKGEFVEISDRLYNWYFADDAAVAALNELADQIAALSKQWGSIVSRLTKVTVASWAEAQIEARARATEEASE